MSLYLLKRMRMEKVNDVYYYENYSDVEDGLEVLGTCQGSMDPILRTISLIIHQVSLCFHLNHFITLSWYFGMKSKVKAQKILKDLTSAHLSRFVSCDISHSELCFRCPESLMGPKICLFLVLLQFMAPALHPAWDACCPYSSLWVSFIFSFSWNLPWKPISSCFLQLIQISSFILIFCNCCFLVFPSWDRRILGSWWSWVPSTMPGTQWVFSSSVESTAGII